MAGTQDRKEVLEDMSKKAKDLEELLDLLSQKGYIQKRARVKRQVIYKTKFVVRKPRTKKEATGEAVTEGQEAGGTGS